MTDAAATGRREKNKQQTRARLLEAARDLLADHGTAATVEEIAERADVSRATFFNYFPSKDDLITALYAQHMESFARVVDTVLAQPLSTYDRIVGIFTDFVQESAAHPDYMRTVTGEIERISSTAGVLPERSQLFTSQVRRVIEAGVERGDVRTDHPPKFLAQMVAAAYLATIRYWQNDPDYDVGGAFDRAGRYAAESLAARTESPRNGKPAS